MKLFLTHEIECVPFNKSVVITLFMRDEAIKMYGESPLTIFETDFDLFRRRVLCDFLILDDTLE